MKSRMKWALIAIIALMITTVVIVVPVVLVLKSRDSDSSSTNEFEKTLNQLTVYPEGSFSKKLSQYTAHADSNRTFLPLDENLLHEIVRIDNSSLIFESGRQQFIYFRIPDTSSLQQNDFDLEAIAMYFGRDSTNLNVIPVPLGEQTRAGVDIIQTNLTDRSRLIRIQLNIPATLCSSLIDSNSCSEIQYNAYLIFSGNQRSQQSFSAQVNVACGDVCSNLDQNTVCAASCISKCIAYELGNTNAPLSRRYHMGRENGTFQVVYDTFQKHHRFKVWSGLNLLMDTGCTQVSSAEYIWLELVNRNSVRVDVEPNCKCSQTEDCSQTNWYFDIGCALPCPYRQSVESRFGSIQLQSNGTVITNDTILYIDENAQMPSIIASACQSVSWRVLFSYQSSTREASQFSYEVTGDSLGNRAFDINVALLGQVFGGSVTVIWTTYAKNETGTIIFTILGSQPQRSLITDYISNNTNLWYAAMIAAQESNGITQFDANGFPYTATAKSNRYGIYQVLYPQYDEFWDWKANVRRGLMILNGKQSSARSWMKTQRELAKTNTGENQPVPNTQVGKYCLFSDDEGKNSINDAVAIKLFNEESENYYCSWSSADLKWTFSPLNSRGEDYVQNVCNQDV